MDVSPGQPSDGAKGIAADSTHPIHLETMTASPMTSPRINRVFMGPYGLRAGWSMSLFVVLFVVILSLGGLAARDLRKDSKAQRATQETAQTSATTDTHKDITVRETAVGETLTFGSTCLATLLMALLERRRLRVYGIDLRTWLNFVPGALWGLASLSLLVFVLNSLHLLVFDSLVLHGAAIYAYGTKWLLTFLLVGLFEEYSTRGFLQYTLTRGLMGLGARLAPDKARIVAFWSAAVIMSIIFGCLHLGNPGETAAGIAMVFLAGILFSYALWRTGSLWWAIGFHMSWDWAQSFLWGVPDSGGLSAGRLFLTHPTGNVLLSGGVDGPEGSLLVLPTLLLVALGIRFTTRQGEQPPLEPDDHAEEPTFAAA